MAREASKKLPEPRGSIFPEYGRVASHGDPIQAQNDLNSSNLYVPDHLFFQTLFRCLILLAGTLSGLDPSKKMHIECLHLQMGGYGGSISHQRSNFVGFCGFQEGMFFAYAVLRDQNMPS